MGGKSAAVALIKWLRTTTATLGQFQTQFSPLFSFSSAASPCSCRHNNGKFCPLLFSVSCPLSPCLSHTHTHYLTVSKMLRKVGGEPLWDIVKSWQPFIKQAKLGVCKPLPIPAIQAHPPPPYPFSFVAPACRFPISGLSEIGISSSLWARNCFWSALAHYHWDVKNAFSMYTTGSAKVGGEKKRH